ncbi:MBL fold metallo-hydrolase [Streptomyces pactum]|uniref:MBL fold metallo-hydrolase n=1 Tax=Streptomyces pactum TaxID=68249 RepID=A0ABS0NRB3_9ACTN|nr:MBL fold metallo-hydrolase [Streptomyces pactum]MBH5337730.1 MBL fold metallo-hydrolase [Streptomyces pactum]
MIESTERQVIRRRSLLAGAVGGVVAGAAGASLLDRSATAAPAGERPPAAASAGGEAAEFRWFGTAGWRIGSGDRTVLFDPYLTRFPTGLFTGAFDPATRLRVDEPLIDRHLSGVRPKLVMVSHSHWDHLNDVPYIARSTGAPVIGTETTYHLLRAFGVDAGQLIVVKGGEVLDFDGCVVEVFSGRHSRNARHSYFAPGTLVAPPRRPRTISDLPEGDTLSFQVTPDGGPSVFLMGGSDFAEREVAGVRPDIAMVATPATSATHRYASRLMTALGRPRTVVPVHWDDFETPLDDPVRADPTVDLDRFVAQLREAAPESRIVVPDRSTTYRWS